MKEAKIQFSMAEAELMGNTEVILTKNSILFKIKTLFEALQNEMTMAVQQHSEWRTHPYFEMPPKISRGENYLGLPYLVLDYPRKFDSMNILAVRTMFWWGHFFSSTLQVAGTYKAELIDKIENAYTSLARRQYYIGINEDPWVHHFEEDNYRKIKELDKDTFLHYCRQYEYLKIAARWPLSDVHFVAEDLFDSWQFLARLCID
ncbi:MAG: hypothetical protein M3342_04985 [Bacteroidota bacterium]|nr:hypothetical protein [Bacteroidota bacterium]